MPKFPFIFVIGSRRSGKSTLTAHLLKNHFQKYDFRIGLCGHRSAAQWYVEQDLLPADYVHDNYKPEILEKWFKKCDKLMKKGQKLPSTLFVLDDILRTRKIKGGITTRQDPWLEKLSICGRHYRCAVILIVHSVSVALSFCRNADLVLTAPSSLYCGQDFKTLCENYMSQDKLKENREILKLFEKYDFLALRYYNSSRKGRKLLSYYRVP